MIFSTIVNFCKLFVKFDFYRLIIKFYFDFFPPQNHYQNQLVNKCLCRSLSTFLLVYINEKKLIKNLTTLTLSFHQSSFCWLIHRVPVCSSSWRKNFHVTFLFLSNLCTPYQDIHLLTNNIRFIAPYYSI